VKTHMSGADQFTVCGQNAGHSVHCVYSVAAWNAAQHKCLRCVRSLSSAARAGRLRLLDRHFSRLQAESARRAACCDGECDGIRSRCEVWAEQDKD
jgi:hypothetical protein